MRRILLVSFVALMAISGLYAQVQDTAQGEPKVNVKVVYEKTFDEPIIDVIFDTATVSIEEAKEMGWKEEAFTQEDKTKGKILVSYPKCVFITDANQVSYDVSEYPSCIREIRFYRRNGELIKKELIQPWAERVVYSENGEFILRSWVPSDDVPEREGGILYKSDGTVVWEKAENQLVAVSNDGYIIATDPFPGPISVTGHVFYDPSGKEIARITNPLKETASGYAAARFSQNGNHAVLGYTDFAKTVVVLCDKQGHILWQQEFNWRSYAPYEMDIVENFGMIGVCNKDGASVFFIDQKGNLRWIRPLEIRGNMIVKISEDKKKAFVVSSVGHLWCIDVDDGKILWKHKESWAPAPSERPWPYEVPRFRELKLDENTIYIIGKQGRDWYSSTLFVFDGENGSLIKRVEYPHEKITFAQTSRGIGLINITKGKVSILRRGS